MTGLSGKTVVVTGATAGIGKVTARELARQGAQVFVVGRNTEKTRAVVTELRAATGNEQIGAFVADLSSMQEVRRVAAELLAHLPRLDVLVNNAGAVNPTFEKTVDGYERTFATNHLGPFLLTNLLLPLLQQSAPARVVCVSSEAHRFSPMDFDNLQAEKGYAPFMVYGRSKLANILFTRELARREQARGVTVNCLHPGVVDSNFMAKGGLWGLAGRLGGLFMISPDKGAETSVHLAASPEVANVTGEYFAKKKVRRTSAAAQDEAAMRRLWDVSVQLTGLGG